MQSPWSDSELRALHAEHLAGAWVSPLAKRRRLRSAVLIAAWSALGLRPRPRIRRSGRRRSIPESLVEAMHREHLAGATFAEIERLHGRPPKSVRSLFIARGYQVIPSNKSPRRRRADGTNQPVIPKTDSEIEAIIAAATSFAIPSALAPEWRHWDIPRRAAFIARLRARFPHPHDRPDLPFSSNIVPFDYGSEHAWDIVRRLNAGRTSKNARTKLDILSQGVIWDDRLWFWTRSARTYIEGIRWIPGRGRKVLARAIWEQACGPIPPGSVIRYRDRNCNNLDPSNLILADRNMVCRENQAKALHLRSRAKTNAILNLHRNPHHANHRSLQNLSR